MKDHLKSLLQHGLQHFEQLRYGRVRRVRGFDVETVSSKPIVRRERRRKFLARLDDRRCVTKTVIFVLLAVGVSLDAQPASITETAGLQNGRSWRSMSEMTKAGYLFGIADGQNAMSLRAYHALKTDGCSKAIGDALLDVVRQSFPKLTIEEKIREIDAFFSEGTNARVPIYDALVWTAAKAGGATRETLEDLAASLRRSASGER
jgi:hypothetical protein